MDNKTKKTLESFKAHLKTKEIITKLCYVILVLGALTYAFFAIDKGKTIKIVNDFKKNQKKYKIEKIMTNPRMQFQYDNNQIYHIKAKKAVHKDNTEAVMYDVFATGKLGNITAGELEIDENGDHLVFTKNPILILNKTND